MSDRLARTLVEVALELRRHLAALPDVDGLPFLLRLEDEPLPLAGVFTEAGELVLMRGESAFVSLVDLLYGEDDSPESRGWDLLSISFLPLDEIALELRGILLEAGCVPRRGERVPAFLVQRPGRRGRGPNRGETKLLLAALRALLRALVLGRFEPQELDEDTKELLELVAHGEGKRLDIEVRHAPWPVDVELPPPDATLADLPQGEERWFVDLLIHPGSGTGADRRGALLLADLATEKLLGREMVSPEVPGELVVLLSNWFEQVCEDASARPASVAYCNESLAEPLREALALLRMEPTHAERPAFLEKIASDFPAHLARRDEALRSDALPTNPEEWDHAHRRLTLRLHELVKDRRSDVAMTRYFGSKRAGERVLSNAARIDALAAFFEWRFFDHRSGPGGPTLAEEAAGAVDCTPTERHILAARGAARLSIFRIDEFLADKQARLFDLATGASAAVDLSQIACDLTLDDCVPFRLYRLGAWTFAAQGGPILPVERLLDALLELERVGAPSAEDPRPGVLFLGHLCAGLGRDAPAPELTNTDGDPLELLRATFTIAAPEVLREKLATMEDVAPREEDRWVWLRPSSTTPDAPRARLASLGYDGGELQVEVNSRRRLASVRRWLETLPGVRYAGAKEQEFTLTPFPRLPALHRSVPREDVDLLAHTLEAEYRSWPDVPISLLGGETPREAVLTPVGRRRVYHLIQAMPATHTPYGPLRPPREWLLAELGFTR